MNYSLSEPRAAPGTYLFGPFRLDAVRRTLSRNGTPVSLPPRLFATLLCLVENAGRVVERDELFHTVWGGRVVEETNLKQTIFALRKALEAGGAADRFIVTAPTRGYQFAAPVRFEAAATNFETSSPAGAEKLNPCRRVAMFIAPALAVAAGAAFVWQPASFIPPPHSVAVLPFTNLSNDPAQTYFSDGISEELIAALSRVGGLHVAARTSSFAVAAKSAVAGDIARQLNVGAILEGSVRRDGPHMRVTASLINARTGFTYWSRIYDRDPGNLLQIQADIAASVTGALQVTLLGGDTAIFTLGGTQNPAAFDAYLRGMKLADTPDTKAALAAFDEAIALDPKFALAHAHRAHVLNTIATGGDISDAAEVTRLLSESQAAADRAIALAPNLGGGHVARGTALMAILDFAGAQKEVSLAHDLSPGDANIAMLYGDMQLAFGHTAAGIEAAAQAAALDPLTPATHIALAGAYMSARRYDDAQAAARHARILGDDLDATSMEGTIALARGDSQAALRSCAAKRNWQDDVCLAIADHAAGRLVEAAAELQTVRNLLGDSGAYQYAEIYAQWSQRSAAVQWLQTAYRLRDSGLESLKSDSLLDPIRADPLYLDIERRLSFPP